MYRVSRGTLGWSISPTTLREPCGISPRSPRVGGGGRWYWPTGSRVTLQHLRVPAIRDKGLVAHQLLPSIGAARHSRAHRPCLPYGWHFRQTVTATLAHTHLPLGARARSRTIDPDVGVTTQTCRPTFFTKGTSRREHGGGRDCSRRPVA